MLPAVRIVCGPIVRRTSSTSASLWVELDQDCVVSAWAKPVLGPSSPVRRPAQIPPLAVSSADFTVKVGGRYYALLTLSNLAPGWVYAYELYYRPNEGRRNPALWPRDPRSGQWWNFNKELESFAVAGKRPTFRTFPSEKTEDVRVAFGSCRVFSGGFQGGTAYGEDVFPLFGEHLRATVTDRLKSWPHLLLLLGDQIYADNVDRQVADARLRTPGRGGKVVGSLAAPESILKWERDRRPGETKILLQERVFGKDISLEIEDLKEYAGWGNFQCLEFNDFAALYVAAWTEPQVARALANLPTFMIFDDHEVANDWNLTGSWIQQAKKAPAWIKAITEGLAAYWMYQGWGNPVPPSGRDGRWTILEAAARDGTDALDKLRKWFEARLALGRAAYYYEIELSPPILVLDTRNDRSFVAPKQRGPNNATVHADYDDEILSEEQWKWLRSRIDHNGPLILASGVPLLQLLCIDVWLLRGTRPVNAFLAGIEEQDQERADIFEYYRRHIGTDQWTAFPKSFVRLTNELFNRGPFVFLSGDVHYAYAMYGRTSFPQSCKLGRNPLILHAVSSPLRSQWSDNQLKRNNPEQCPGLATPATMIQSAKTKIDINVREKAASPCDFLEEAEFTRVFLPDAAPIFGSGTQKAKWTHLNNIGIVQIWKDGKSVKVSWLGASTKKGEALRELGSIASRPGEFVR